MSRAVLTESSAFECPWCGERNFVEVEPGDAGQWVVQDCAVCCNPIEIQLPADGGSHVMLRVERGD